MKPITFRFLLKYLQTKHDKIFLDDICIQLKNVNFHDISKVAEYRLRTHVTLSGKEVHFHDGKVLTLNVEPNLQEMFIHAQDIHKYSNDFHTLTDINKLSAYIAAKLENFQQIHPLKWAYTNSEKFHVYVELKCEGDNWYLYRTFDSQNEWKYPVQYFDTRLDGVQLQINFLSARLFNSINSFITNAQSYVSKINSAKQRYLDRVERESQREKVLEQQKTANEKLLESLVAQQYPQLEKRIGQKYNQYWGSYSEYTYYVDKDEIVEVEFSLSDGLLEVSSLKIIGDTNGKWFLNLLKRVT